MNGLMKGMRVEISSFRNGRQFSDYYAYDGFRGSVEGPTESGARVWVLIDGTDVYRSGKKGLPPEILMPVGNGEPL